MPVPLKHQQNTCCYTCVIWGLISDILSPFWRIYFALNCTNFQSCLGDRRLWSYGSWVYNYLCNQCLSPLTLWVWIPLRRGLLNTTLCDNVCQCLTAGQWFSPISSSNKTVRHDITEMLLKVALNTITPNLNV